MKPDVKIRFMWKQHRAAQAERLSAFNTRFLHKQERAPAYVFRKRITGSLCRTWVWVAQANNYWFAYPTKDEAIAGATMLVLQGHASRVLKRRPKYG